MLHNISINIKRTMNINYKYTYLPNYKTWVKQFVWLN